MRNRIDCVTKEDAIKFYHEVQLGNGPSRQEYIDRFPVGGMAREYWQDSMFAYGNEYGMLIAIAYLFGLEPEDV